MSSQERITAEEFQERFYSESGKIKEKPKVKRKRKHADRSLWKPLPELRNPVTFRVPLYPSRNEYEGAHKMKKYRLKKDYMDTVIKCFTEQGISYGHYYPHSCKIEIRFYFTIKRRRDLGNYEPKWLNDALQGLILWDDSPEWVTVEYPEFNELINKEDPHILLRVSRLD